MNKDEIIKVFRNIPVLETEHLILRRMQKSDADDMYDYAKRHDTTRYLLWNPHPDRKFTYQYLVYLNHQYKVGEFHDWAVIERESDRMIGTCGFTRFDYGNDGAEIGYVLNPDFWGRGYATEAVRRVIRFGFDYLGLHRLEAKYMEGNNASRRVMEKCGMTFEGVRRDSIFVKGGFVSVGVCSILRTEYNQNRIGL
ncbi:MAG: GNAT family N-acetyltransferase [Ruminococcaceae bacterium]|nr:GNAT family N-acetyltransferase [Oscillospiraceae bacterium]